MQLENKSQEQILKQLEKFEKENPEIINALKVFQISMEEYAKAYQFLTSPTSISSNRTSSV